MLDETETQVLEGIVLEIARADAMNVPAGTNLRVDLNFNDNHLALIRRRILEQLTVNVPEGTMQTVVTFGDLVQAVANERNK